MKIIHYIPSIDRASGGIATYMQLLAKELGRLVELHLATHDSTHKLPIEHTDFHFLETIHHYNIMKRQWERLLLEVDPDIIHINCCWTPSCAFLQQWAQKMGFKVVLSPHGMLEPWILKRHYWTKKVPALLLYQKAAIVNADMLHATAESEKANILKLGYNDKITVIANGIDLDNIQMKDTWSRKKTILFLSRVHVKKGIGFLIEAVAELKKEMKGYKVYIAGEGDVAYIENLKVKAELLGISDWIIFEGGVYGDRKWELYRQADLFVLPTHSENFGIVVAEALACGIPVITTKGTPWSELESEHCGWWTEIGTEGTVQALREFLALKEEDLEIMGRNGRRLVESRYSEHKIAKEFVALYNKMISK